MEKVKDKKYFLKFIIINIVPVVMFAMMSIVYGSWLDILILSISATLFIMVLLFEIFNKNESGKGYKIKKIVIIVARILFLIFIIWAIYVLAYSRASQYSKELVENPSDGYSVTYEGEDIVFEPKSDDYDTGLIFYPGGKVQYQAYSPILSGLAKKGILCVLVKEPDNLAILDINAADGIEEKFPEIKNWYIGGHSLGGACASIYAAKNSDMFKGLILLGAYPSSDLSDSHMKALSIYGSNDGVLNKKKYKNNKSYFPDEFTEYVIDGGCHAYFGDYGFQLHDGKPIIDKRYQWNLTIGYIAEFVQE